MGPADVLHAEQIKLQMVIYLQNFGSKDDDLTYNRRALYQIYIYVYLYR